MKRFQAKRLAIPLLILFVGFHCYALVVGQLRNKQILSIIPTKIVEPYSRLLGLQGRWSLYAPSPLFGAQTFVRYQVGDSKPTFLQILPTRPSSSNVGHRYMSYFVKLGKSKKRMSNFALATCRRLELPGQTKIQVITRYPERLTRDDFAAGTRPYDESVRKLVRGPVVSCP